MLRLVKVDENDIRSTTQVNGFSSRYLVKLNNGAIFVAILYETTKLDKDHGLFEVGENLRWFSEPRNLRSIPINEIAEMYRVVDDETK